MRMNSTVALVIYVVLTMLFMECTTEIAGGTSEQGNSRVTGQVILPAGKSGPIKVQLVPENYNPWTDSIGMVYEALTDSMGNYSFDSVAPGNYYFNARDTFSQAAILRGPFTLEDASEKLREDTLPLESSFLSITLGLDAGDSIYALYIRGTTEVIRVMPGMTLIEMAVVPAGTFTVQTVIRNTATMGFTYNVFCEDVTAEPGTTTGISYRNLPPKPVTNVSDLNPWFWPGVLYTDTVKAIDPEGETVNYFLLEGPDGFTIDAISGVAEWVPGQSGYIGAEVNVVVAATDSRGAISTIAWGITKASQTTAPAAPAGALSRNIPDTIYQYSVKAIACAQSVMNYRFSWGDGDTSGWAATTVQKHFWHTTGTFILRAQAYCSADQLPSAWSDSLIVRVTGEAAVASDLRVSALDTANVSEAVRISAGKYGCAGARYRFYLNSRGITGWIADTSILYVSDVAGSFQLTVAVVCDLSIRGSVRVSAPAAVRFMQVYAPCTPRISANIYLMGGSGYEVSAHVPAGSCAGFGDSCFYRYVVRSLVAEKSFVDTSDWYDASELSVTAIMADSISLFGTSTQMRCKQDAGYATSDWSPVDSVIPIYK